MTGSTRHPLLRAAVFTCLIAIHLAASVNSAEAATLRLTAVSATPRNVSPTVAPRRVTIRYRLSAPAKVTITVTNASGLARRILTDSSQSAGSKSITWNLKLTNGAVAGNGTYTINVSAKDRHGGSSVPSRVRSEVRVDATRPYGYATAVSPVSISSAVPQTATITYRLSDNITASRLTASLEIVDWSGAIVDRRTQTDVSQGTGRTFEWNGRTTTGAPVEPGAYWARIRVRDLAGNERASTRTLTAWLHVNGYGHDRPLDTGIHTHLIARAETRNGVTHVAYNDRTADGNTIRYRSIDASGNTMVAPVAVSSALLTTDYDRGVPDISADQEGGAFVVWRGPGPTSTRRAIWLARLDRAGTVQWSRRVLDESSSSYPVKDPRVSVSPDGLAHVVCWRTGSPNAILYATFRADGNAVLGWSSIAGGSTSAQRKLPNVHADTFGRIHIAWYDSVDHPGSTTVGRREIYYTRLAYSNGMVSPPSAEATIDRRRLTSTDFGYSPAYAEAPALATDDAGSLHVVWPDQRSAHASRGIRYLKLAPSGSVAIASRNIADGSPASTGPRAGNHPGVAATKAGGAVIVYQALTGLTGPTRVWQVDVDSRARATRPFLATTGRTRDERPFLAGEPGGPVRLVYGADTGVPLGGSVRRQLLHKDLTGDPSANDITRPDLQIDTAHAPWTSTPTPPRQNDSVTVSAIVRNSGWAPLLGGIATLSYQGVAVDSSPIPPLAVEATATVTLRWRVPDDATSTPAPLEIRVIPSGDQTQTTTANDTAPVLVPFRVPPTSTHLLVAVCDETDDEARMGWRMLDDATATLSGTTVHDTPYSANGTRTRGWIEFFDVPLGTYTLTHAAPGYLVSQPTARTITVAQDPADRYRLLVTPPPPIEAWVNRWGALEGTVHESGGTTPVAGARITLLASGATSLTPATGTYRLSRLPGGTISLKVTKSGWGRLFLNPVVVPAQVNPLDIPLARTTDGYLVGTITDTGAQPLGRDPESTADDPSLTIKRTDGSVVRTVRPPDGHFDITLPSGTYRLDFRAPGHKPRLDISVTIRAGEETERTTALDIDVSGLISKKTAERWCVPWTIHANWFGSQPPKSPLPSYDLKMWFGMFRFSFEGSYQRVGTADHIRLVRTRVIGEAWDWHYLKGVTPPTAPKVFERRQDLLGLYDDRFEPPMLIPGNRWNRTGVRVDGVDIVDQRDWRVVSRIRSQWNSCEEESHLYGTAGTITGDGTFPAYTHTVPWSQQLVRLWITVGRMDPETGAYRNAAFQELSSFNQGQLLQGSGYNRLMLYWRPTDGYLWVEPAIVGYP